MHRPAKFLFSYRSNSKSSVRQAFHGLKTIELIFNRHYLIRKQINEESSAERNSDGT